MSRPSLARLYHLFYTVFLFFSSQTLAELAQIELTAWCEITSVSSGGASVGDHLAFEIKFTHNDVDASCCDVVQEFRLQSPTFGGGTQGWDQFNHSHNFLPDRFEFYYPLFDTTFQLVYSTGVTVSNFNDLESAEFETLMCIVDSNSGLGEFEAETNEFILNISSANSASGFAKDVPIPFFIFLVLGMLLLIVAVKRSPISRT